MRITLTLILVAASLLCASVIAWEVNNPEAGNSKSALTFIAAFLGLQDTLMTLSYLVLFRQLHKYFEDYLIKEKNQLLTIYGLMLLSILVQTLYFLGEVK